MAELLEGRKLLATITVNTAGDADGADGSDTISLRQAIEVSNGTLAVSSLTAAQQALVSGAVATGVANTIDFDIPGTGPFTISPAPANGALPVVTSAVTIDGYSQPGASPNTNGPGLPDNAIIEVELNGNQLLNAPQNDGSGPPPYYSSGLVLMGGDTVRGLAVDEFSGIIGGTSDTPTFYLGGGIALAGGTNTVSGNFIGVGTTGLAEDGNVGVGVFATDASGLIGGTSPADRNVIADNTINVKNGDGKGDLLIQGNFIGVDATGARAFISTSRNITGIGSAAGDTIGGTVAGAGNVISGNQTGIVDYNNQFILSNSVPLGHPGEDSYVSAPSGLPQSVLIQGNLIGTDLAGSAAVGNVVGISVQLFGTAIIANNVISGNLQNGLESDQTASGLVIRANRIGTNAAGTSALPNGGDGLHLAGNLDTITGNVISGNAGNGLAIVPQPASFARVLLNLPAPTGNETVLGNFIGTDLTGTKALPNGGDGILAAGANDTIGGTTAGASNVIAFDKGDGVAVVPYDDTTATPAGIVPGSGQGNRISANLIYPNVIDLGPDADANNPAGSATGPNHLQPAPVINSADIDGSITATLAALPSTTYTVEFFAYSESFGLPSTFLGSTTVTTDASGNVAFSFTAPSSLFERYITATATDPSGDTSEFASGPHGYYLAGSSDTQPGLPGGLEATVNLIGPSTPTVAGQPAVFAAVVSSPFNITLSGFVAFYTGSLFLGVAPVDANGVAVFVTDALPAGANGLSATYLDANPSSGVSNLALLYVAPAGPTVTSAAFTGNHTVKVTFSEPLLASTAKDKANFTLTAPNGQSLTIKSAAYNAKDDSVTLTTSQTLNTKQAYSLKVTSRVMDINRVPLAGTDGRARTNFVGQVTK